MCANYSHRGVGAEEVRDDADEMRPPKPSRLLCFFFEHSMDYLPDYTYVSSRLAGNYIGRTKFAHVRP